MLCIDASGRGVNGDPESRLEPDRIESLRNDLPTQYPEDPKKQGWHTEGGVDRVPSLVHSDMASIFHRGDDVSQSWRER